MIDWTKPVQTREGRKVTIYCTDVPGGYPVHGRIDGSDSPLSWTISGRLIDSRSGPDDLVNGPPKMIKVDCWINVYPDEVQIHASRFDANDNALESRVACIHVVREVEEGTFE